MTKIIPLAEEEKEKILANYFKSGKYGKLDVFPSKEKANCFRKHRKSF